MYCKFDTIYIYIYITMEYVFVEVEFNKSKLSQRIVHLCKTKVQHWLSVLVVCWGGIRSKSSDSIDSWNSCKLNVSLNVCLAFGPGKKCISTSLFKIKINIFNDEFNLQV